MKKGYKIAASLILLLALSVLCFTACESECTVTFEPCNGEQSTSVTVSAFSRLPDIEAPTKPGYAFSGWFLDEGCTVEFGSTSLVTGSITLYAGWEVDTERVVNTVSGELMSANLKIRSCFYDYSYGGYNLTSSSMGSGVIFTRTGKTYYALTNCHVTKAPDGTDKTAYFVYDMYGNEYEASLLCSEAEYDLAVLSFYSPKTLQVADFAERIPDENELVVALGQPAGQYNSLTLGHVIDYEKIEVTDSESDESDVKFEVIWSTAPTAKGSSGGGLFDVNKKLLGINYATGKSSSGDIYTFTIPIAKVNEFLEKYGIEI